MRARIGVGAALAVLAGGGCGGGGAQPGTLKKTFVVPHVFEQRGRISQVAVGDLTGDGVPDLAVLDRSSASVTLLASTALRESPTLPSTGRPARLVQGAAAYEPGARAFVWSSAQDLGVADMDLDGRPDLLVAGGSAGQVGVWPSEVTLTGRFRYHEWTWPSTVTVAGSCDRVAAGDVNGDGKPDLVTLDESKGQAHVLLQSPTVPLTFAPGNDPPPVGACRGLVLCDLDRDGDLDLVTNREAADVVSVLLQGGAAGWAIRESPTRASTGKSMAVGDVDGDGWLDVVVLVEGGASAVCLHQRPDGTGAFDTSESPLGISVDESGDPVGQMAIKEQGLPRAGHAVGEDGTTRLPLSGGHGGVPGGARCVSQMGLALADVDRDGALDLVLSPPAADPDQDPLVAFAIRESPTRWSPCERMAQRVRESPSRPSLGRARALADLDQDGHVDVITGDPDFDLLRLLYVGDTVPPPPPAYHERLRIVPTAQTTGRGIADLDRDGLPDLVTSTTTGLEVRFQNPAAPGTYASPVVLLPGQSLNDVAIGDVNRDGCPDLLVCTAQACALVRRDPSSPRGFLAAVAVPPAPPGGNFRALQLADLDADGFLDCVAIRESPSKASLGRGRAQGFFDVFTEVSVAVKNPEGACVADLDGDGRLDLAVCGSGECAVVLQDPAAPLTWRVPQTLPLMHGVRVAAGDVNGDGRADVIASGDQGVVVALQSALEDGTFLPAYALSLEACGGLALGDLDRDGALDVCFVEAATGTLVGIGGDPDFDLLRVISLNGLPPGSPVRGITVASGDLDGDGKADVVVTGPSAAGAAGGALLVVADGP